MDEGEHQRRLILFRKFQKALSSSSVYQESLRHSYGLIPGENKWSRMKDILANIFGVSGDLVDELGVFMGFCEKPENPSYRVLNENEDLPKASWRTELEHQVLNDTLMLVEYDLEGCARKTRISTLEEMLWDQFEDDKYQLDMTVEKLRITTELAEKLLQKMMIQADDSKPIRLGSHLRYEDIRRIQILYGIPYFDDLSQILKDNPRDALPRVVPRLRKKLEEFKKAARLFTFKFKMIVHKEICDTA